MSIESRKLSGRAEPSLPGLTTATDEIAAAGNNNLILFMHKLAFSQNRSLATQFSN
jgi:hypothetical protein